MACGPRVTRAEVELDRLRTEHEAWLAKRRRAPEAERYKSQLDAVDELIRCGAEQLTAGLAAIDLSQPEGVVYETCRTFDLRVLWLRRVWQFFKEKFDQRDGELADTLRAADEIVWSCYHQIFERARVVAPRVKAGPPPLPFIEARYSPSTFPADLVPAGLQSEVDRPFLRQHLNRLPVPVVRLQPACVSGPWWLVYAAHEVGHSVQYDLLAGHTMVGKYRQLVECAVSDSGGDDADAARWGDWSREIFADLFSVLMMGPWAIWAMVELELQTDKAMTERRDLYPAGAVRLALLDRAATALGLDTAQALRGVQPTRIAVGSASASRDVGFIDAVVAASLRPLPSLQVSLASLCNFSPADFQRPNGGTRPPTQVIRAALAAGQQVVAEKSLSGPRFAAAASLAAWSDVMTTADAAGRSRLAGQTLRLVTDSGPPGTRATSAAVDAAGSATDVVRSLLAADQGELES
jgi:hypothetical protein